MQRVEAQMLRRRQRARRAHDGVHLAFRVVHARADLARQHRQLLDRRRACAPAIEAARAKGLDVTGPHPADTMFHAGARASYDAAICMYHDQALVPFKTLAFEEGVNVTLGLPFIRTSPDHGTAFRIAGTGKANPRSLIEALRLAAAMSERGRGARVSTPDGLPPLREVIRALGLSAKKSLGQNFLLDLNLTRRIAREAGPLEGMTVVEIGPGPGGLTRALADRRRRPRRRHRERRALPARRSAISPRFILGGSTIVAADAKAVDYCALGLACPSASSPICPTAWRPPSSSPGSRPSPGRLGSTGSC